VETSAILLPGTLVRLTLSVEQETVQVVGQVVRMDMGIGAALKFNEAGQELRTKLGNVLEKLAKSDLGMRVRTTGAGKGAS
jgi:hypothetical protein